MGGARYKAWKHGQITDLKNFVYMKPNEIWSPAPAIKNLNDLTIQTVNSLDGEKYVFHSA